MVEDLIVRDLMTRDFIGVSESDVVADVAELLLDENASVIAVLRGNEAVGSVNAEALLAVMVSGRDPDSTRIDEIMAQPPDSIRPDETLTGVAPILADADTDHVFVSTGEELLGVLSENDVVTAVMSLLLTEQETNPEQINAPTPANNGPREEEIQSVCEICGTLKTDLEEVNGQLVCADCRGM